MMWLFGQIWLWLILAFALGALTSWLVLRTTRRPEPKPEAAPAPAPEPRYEPPEPSAAEQTQFIPAAWAQHPRPEPEQDADAPEPVGHREGRLPLPPQRGAEAEDWPTEEEPAWPEADPQWPQQPGRGG
jgi:hypothetical protein